MILFVRTLLFSLVSYQVQVPTELVKFFLNNLSLQAAKERLEKEIEERKELFEQELIEIEKGFKDR